MTNSIVNKARKALGHVKSRITPAVAEFRRREQAKFQELDPRVQALKASPAAQVAVAVSIAGLLVTGRVTTALAVGTAWIGSRPLTHVAAGTVACVGAVDERMRQIIVRLQQAKAKNKAGTKTPAARRRARPKLVPSPVVG